jgi:hypothetical protein
MEDPEAGNRVKIYLSAFGWSRMKFLTNLCHLIPRGDAVAFLVAGLSCIGNAGGQTGGHQLSLMVPPQLLHNAIAGHPYEAKIEMSGGAAPVHWEQLTPLPPGLRLEADAETRHTFLCGDPDRPGDYPVSLLVSDARGEVVIAEFLLRVVTLPQEVSKDPTGDLDGDGVGNLAEYSAGLPLDIPNGLSSPRIVVEPDASGRPVMRLPVDPDVTEIERVVQTWDESLERWSSQSINPQAGESIATIALPYSSDLARPVLARVLYSTRTTSIVTLEDLLKKLEEAREAVEGASDDLEENPLVQEVRLIELIKTIMETPSEIQEFFEGWLKDELIPDFSDLEDDEIDAVVNRFNAEAEKLKNALCYAKKLLQFLARFSDANTARFEAVIARIDALKNLMDHSQNFEAIYSDLRRAIEDLQGLLKDKSEDFLKEKLKDTIGKLLIRKLGKAAAGAVLGAAIDAFDLLDALIAQGRLEEAKKLYYLLHFRMLELAYERAKYRLICEPWNTDTSNPRIQWADCRSVDGKRVALRACVRYWAPKPGGAPNEGSYHEVPVPFKDDAFTIVRDPFSSEVPGECALPFRLDWAKFAEAAGNHPHTHLVIKVTIGDKAPQRVFGGSYRP